MLIWQIILYILGVSLNRKNNSQQRKMNTIQYQGTRSQLLVYLYSVKFNAFSFFVSRFICTSYRCGEKTFEQDYQCLSQKIISRNMSIQKSRTILPDKFVSNSRAWFTRISDGEYILSATDPFLWYFNSAVRIPFR